MSTEEWKIVAVDNYARESVADILICESFKSKLMAEQVAEFLNSKEDDPTIWYTVYEQHQRLSRGMEDLI